MPFLCPVHSTQSIPTGRIKFLFTLTVWNWIVSGLIAILFYLAVGNHLAGTDWLAILLLGVVFLGWIITAYYYCEGSKPIQPPLKSMVWSLFLSLVTIINIFTLVQFVLGRWEDFPIVPLLTTFPLILIAGALRFPLMKKSPRELGILITWSLVLFLLATSTTVIILELARGIHLAQ